GKPRGGIGIGTSQTTRTTAARISPATIRWRFVASTSRQRSDARLRSLRSQAPPLPLAGQGSRNTRTRRASPPRAPAPSCDFGVDTEEGFRSPFSSSLGDSSGTARLYRGGRPHGIGHLRLA